MNQVLCPQVMWWVYVILTQPVKMTNGPQPKKDVTISKKAIRGKLISFEICEHI